ncbi:MAG: cytochrome P460 family protein [Oligoflexales bacterium]
MVLKSLGMAICGMLFSGMSFAQNEPASPVPFPKGYRDWTHVKSMVIFDNKHPLFDAFGGIHHIYADNKALKAIRDNKPFENGATIVFDLLEAKDSGGTYTEGKRKFLGVMVWDSKKYAATQNWGWQVFPGGSQKPSLAKLSDQKACATCHLEVKAKHFVFTEYRP